MKKKRFPELGIGHYLGRLILYYLQHERPRCVGYSNTRGRRKMFIWYKTDANVVMVCETLQFYGPIGEAILKMVILYKKR